MEIDPSKLDSIRDDIWRWAADNMPALRGIAHKRPRGPDRTTSIINSFLARWLRQPSTALRKVRNRFGYAANAMRNVVMGRLRKRTLETGALLEAKRVNSSSSPENTDDSVQNSVFQRAWNE